MPGSIFDGVHAAGATSVTAISFSELGIVLVLVGSGVSVWRAGCSPKRNRVGWLVRRELGGQSRMANAIIDGGSHHSALIVEPHATRREGLHHLLETAGFRATSAATFEEGRRLLTADPPDVLITALRLGAYNGLHLVLRSRVDRPDLIAIVTSEIADVVLQAEAERENAMFMARPFHDDQLLDAVKRRLEREAASAHARNTAS